MLVMGAVTVAACFAGFTQLRHISSANEALTNGALPVLIQTQSVERELGDMFIALERATFAQETSQLVEAKRDLIERIETFRAQVVAATQSQGNTGLTSRLLTELSELEASVHQLLARQEMLFETESQIDALERDLARVGSRAQEALRTLRYDATIRIETLLEQARSGAAPEADTIDQLFSDLFLASLNLTSLSTDIDTLIDLARIDRRPENSGGFDEIRADVEARLRRTAALLAQLNPSVHRTDLAGLTLELNDLVLGDRGLIAIGEAKLLHEEELMALRQAKLDMTGEVSRFIDDMLSEAKTSVAARSQTLDEATRLLSIFLILCLFLAATITLIGHTIIIEQQINRRMGRLSDAVKAIANGDLEHPIDIKGKDELGDIARALHVFKQNAEELRRSNIDLERFAYVAAHDLRAPLRAVHDLSEWTLDDDENVLTDESRSYLTMMQSRTQRLDRLLIDLLDYARAGQEDQGLADVDIDMVIDQIIHLLAPADSFTVTFTGPTRSVRTYPTPLKQILINLISNAIKHHDRSGGEITVSATFEKGRLRVEVADNGPGIPLAYQERIYELFQTLKPRDEVEGSGLGLAIIRKILDRYRAELILRSDPEVARGSAFSFDLPAEEIVETAATNHADAA